MSDRSPTLFDRFAALVELQPRDRRPQVAFGVVKRTYRIADGALHLDAPQDLLHDIRREDLKPRWPAGSDYFPFKPAPDVAVIGSAYGSSGRPIERRRVSVRVHRAQKSVEVFGRREVEWTDAGKPKLGLPEPFEKMSLAKENAYGGHDRRVPFPPPTSMNDTLRLAVDRPGMYPRNQFGKGYLVVDEPILGVELPNLEDPDHLLTGENLLVGDPRHWHRQPLPWYLDWQTPGMFPRLAYTGETPWFPVPSDATLEEVTRGLLPAEWRSLAGGVTGPKPLPKVFFQEASLGLTFQELKPGIPFELVGMHPEHPVLTFAMPEPPRLEIDVEGDRQAVEARVMHVVITPDESRVEITWGGVRREMKRMFVPGIHGDIPITLFADGAPVRFVTPKPIRAQLKEAEKKHGGPFQPSKHLRKPGEKGYYEVQGLLHPEGPSQRKRDQFPRNRSPKVGYVDPSTSRVLFEEPMHEVAGALGVSFRLFYSSTMSWRAGALGLGWSHSFEQMVWEAEGRLFYRTDDGRELRIPTSNEGLTVGAWARHPGHGLSVLKMSPEAYEVRLADGRRFGFSRIDGHKRARLTRLYSADSVQGVLFYDAHGRLSHLATTSASLLRFEHDARGRLTRLFQPSRSGSDEVLAARFEIDAGGQLTGAYDALGRGIRYRYQAGLLVQRTVIGPSREPHAATQEPPTVGEARGFVYDRVEGQPRVISERLGEDAEHAFHFDSEAHIAGVTDAVGASTYIAMSPSYAPIEIRDASGFETHRTYDEQTGLVIREVRPTGETRFTYDDSFLLRAISSPNKGNVVVEHDAAGRLIRWDDADGHTMLFAWDPLGRLSAHRDRVGRSVVYTYEGEGPLASILTPTEVALRLVRDARTEAIQRVVSPLGERAAGRDGAQRIATITDESGETLELRYDATGRVSHVVHPGNLTEVFESSAQGDLLSSSDGVRRTVYERDESGRVVAVLAGDLGMRLHRDVEGRVKMVESEGYDFWEIRRNSAGRVIEEAGFPGVHMRHQFRDHDGSVKRLLTGERRTDVTRDAAGRPTLLLQLDETDEQYRWSAGGRLVHARSADRTVELTYDGLGRVALEKRDDGHWVSSAYGAHGRRDKWSTSLGLSVSVERDVHGDMVRMTATRGERTFELKSRRDARGFEQGRDLAGGVSVRWARDPMGRVLQRTLTKDGQVLGTLGYKWAGRDQLLETTDVRGTQHHRYDARGRLIQVGRRVRVLDETGRVFFSEARDELTYAAGGILSEMYGIAYRYDRDGRRTERETPDGTITRYRYDASDRLTEVALSSDERIVYQYDALGRCVLRRTERRSVIEGLDEPVWESQRERRFYWDGFELVHEVEGASVVSWLWEAGELVGKIDDVGAYAVLTDPFGRPTELTDQKGAFAWRGSVDLLGAADADVMKTACPWRFAGHYQDPETGLLHSWARVYDPETGGYLTPHPFGVIAGTNLYAYLDDPVTKASPLGLGEGYQRLAGSMRSDRLEAEMIERIITALDRGDGAAGPRAVFDCEAARPRLPDPEALLFGRWAPFMVTARQPPAPGFFTRLPSAAGLSGDSDA